MLKMKQLMAQRDWIVSVSTKLRVDSGNLSVLKWMEIYYEIEHKTCISFSKNMSDFSGILGLLKAALET